MTVTVDAVYENGAFKTVQPVALPEGTPVRLVITPVDETTIDESTDPISKVIGVCKGGPTDSADQHDRIVYNQPTHGSSLSGWLDSLESQAGLMDGPSDYAAELDAYLYGAPRSKPHGG